MEWFRRRKAKKNFKKLKEAYDLGYRHAREDMQVELDDLQKQISEASEREKQLVKEIGLLRNQMAVERREHCNAFVTVAKQFAKAYYKLKVKKVQQQAGKGPSSPLPLTAHKLSEPTVGEETDNTASQDQHMWVVKDKVLPPPPGFETVSPKTPPLETKAGGAELQGSRPLPEEETSSAFATVVPKTPPEEHEAEGVELQDSQPLPEEETSASASSQPLQAE